MAENGEKKKLGSAIALFGWFVAVASLFVNFLGYRLAQREAIRSEEDKPTYVTELSTYDPKSLPEDVSLLHAPIRHRFSVTQRSGGNVRGLVLNFKSQDRPIQQISITDGITGTTQSIEPSGRQEAEVRKEDLLPGGTLTGYVVTDGITKLTMSSGAAEGKRFDPLAPPLTQGANWSTVLSTVLIAIGVFCLAAVTFYLAWRSMPSIKQAGFLEEIRSHNRSLALLALLALATVLPFVPNPSQIVSILVCYFVITRFKMFSHAIESSLRSLSERRQVASAAPLKSGDDLALNVNIPSHNGESFASTMQSG